MQKIIQKLYTKRLLYAACFILFMLIDWTRGSQIGVVWAWTVNMTGIVMALIIFSSFKPGELRRKEYLVYTVLCAAALPLSYLWWQCHQAVIYRDKLLSAVLNVWASCSSGQEKKWLAGYAGKRPCCEDLHSGRSLGV
jgi:hypothetical protein